MPGRFGTEPLPGLRRPKFGTVFWGAHALPGKLFRQAEQSLRALAIFSIHEHQRAVVRLGNLTA